MRSGRTETRTDRSEGADRRNGVQRNDTATNEPSRDRPTTDETARGEARNAPNERRAVHTLQETLGNQAVQGLHRSGELDRFLRQERPGRRPGRREDPERRVEASTARSDGAQAADPQTDEPTVTGVPTAERPAIEPTVEEPVIEEPAAVEEPNHGTVVAGSAGTVDTTAHGSSPAEESAVSSMGIERTVPATRESTPLDVETPIAEAAAERPDRMTIDVPVPAAPVPSSPSEVVDPSGPVDAAVHEREAEAPLETGSEATRPPVDQRTDEDRGPPAAASTPAEPASDPDTGPSPASGATTRIGRPEAAGVAGEQLEATAIEEALEPVEEAGAASERAPVSQGEPGNGDIHGGTADVVPTSRAALATAEPDRPPEAAAPSGGTGIVPQPPSLAIQAKLTVGRSSDRFEREADAVAAAVTADRPPPAVSAVTSWGFGGTASRRFEEEDQSPEPGEELVQTRAAIGGPGTEQLLPSTASTVRNPGPGRPLPQDVRSRVEPRLGADLGGVRVHAGARAARAAGSLGAHAFTHRNHVFLGNGQSAHDVRLMAHEATHVVQQGVTSGGRTRSGTPSADVQPLFGVPDSVLERVSEYARYIPGWTLFTVIVGTNPITGAEVDRTPINLVQGLLELVPGGPTVFDALQEHRVLQDAFEWVRGELDRLNLSLTRIGDTIESAWDRISLWSLDEAPRIVREEFTPLYEDVVSFADSVLTTVMEIVKDALVGVAEDILAENRAWDLIKKVLGHDPLRDEEVDARPAEILEDFLLLIGKEEHLEQMRERGTLEETAQWLAEQIGRFESLLGQLGDLIDRAWDAIQPENLPNVTTNLRELATQVGTFLQNVWDFAWDVASEVLERIKDALLGWLADYANQIPGFHLVTVIVGRNPFTGEAVPRTAQNLIRGFITLLPGGAGIYQQLAESGVIEGAAGRIEAAMSELGITWEFVVGLFTDLWNSLSIEDLASPLETFGRIVDRFGEPISRLVAFVGVVIREVIFLLLQAMNFPTDIVESIVTGAMAAIEDIKRDPIGFLTNMLVTIKQGFQKFFGNILSHLVGGLADWLFRGMREAGVEPPADLTFPSILEFVLELLGLTTDHLWELLAQRIGQENVDRIRGAIDRLTGILEFVNDVRERGIAAVWEYIEGQLTGLWDMVLERAREWIMERVISRAVQWLMSLLDPSGVMAVVNSVRSFIAAIESAAEYARDILAIVNRYVSTIAAVARGDTGPGAEQLEQGLASAIPIAIGFLMNQLGLGDVSGTIRRIVEGLRQLIDRGLSWLIDRAVSAIESVLRTLGFGGEEEEEDEPVDPSDHGAVAERAITDMETPVSDAHTYESLRAAKEDQARQLEDRYGALLEPGIGLFIRFSSASSDVADQDLDFTVTVAPNNETRTGSVSLREEEQGVRLEGGILYVRERPFQVGDQIQVARGRGWARGPHYIQSFETRDINNQTFIMLTYDTDPSGDRGTITALSYPTQWRAPIPSLQELSSEELQTENARGVSEPWSDFPTAKKVLNYRAHGIQTVNPPNTDWEHIVEQGTGGVHTAENLALTAASINNELAAYYATVRTYPELALEDVTEPIVLREYLRGKSKDVQLEWKMKVYRRLNLTLRWDDKGRGRYRILERG